MLFFARTVKVCSQGVEMVVDRSNNDPDDDPKRRDEE
jgi:hypothetical protein